MVSIIVPIFNVERYLEECLDSIRNQTYPHLDVILVNDGSTDTSLEIAKKFVRLDSRFILIDKPNGGLSSARNIGIEFIKGTPLRTLLQKYQDTKNTKGGGASIPILNQFNTFNPQESFRSIDEILQHFSIIENNIFQTNLENNLSFILQKIPDNRYIHFIDSDDYFLPNCLENCIQLTQQENYDIIWHNHKIFIENNRTFIDNTFKQNNAIFNSGADFFKQLKAHYFPWVWKGMFKTNLLNTYQLRFQFRMDYEDCDFGTILFLLAKKIIYRDFIGMIYRIRPYSLSNFTDNDFNFPSTMPKHLEELRTSFFLYRDLKIYFGAYCFIRIASSLANMQSYYQISDTQKEILEHYKIVFLALGISTQITPILTLKKNDPKSINPKIRTFIENLSLVSKIKLCQQIFIIKNLKQYPLRRIKNLTLRALRRMIIFLRN